MGFKNSKFKETVSSHFIPTDTPLQKSSSLEKVEEAVLEQKEDPLPPLNPQEQKIVEQLKKQLDPRDRNSVIYFGTEAQQNLDDISSKMLEGVKNKDLGEAGESMTQLISTLKGFKVEEFTEEAPWWKKLLGLKKGVEELFERYKDIKEQIDYIANRLEQQKHNLNRDLIALEKLYHANLDYFRQLELYIRAGEEKIKELEEELIPKLEQKAKKTNNLLDAQLLKEIAGYKLDLERRIHDLKLSRNVTLQNLPRIRLIQENDKALVTKITSLLLNTIPIWKNQLAQAVAIYRSKEVASNLREASNFTNELLRKNAEGLREANQIVKTEVERGIFDIETIKEANKTLIATLEDSLKIAEEGKLMRQKAQQELKIAEQQLRQALLAIKNSNKINPNTTDLKSKNLYTNFDRDLDLK